MLILGIETSCDETAAAVVKDGREIFSNVVVSSLNDHQQFGGVIPEIASRKQLECIYAVTEQALLEAGVQRNQLDAIAVTCSPGLIGSLLVGLSFARALSFALKKPLIKVNHVHAHLYACFLSYVGKKESGRKQFLPQPKLPAIGLVVSGGHTNLYHMRNYNDYILLGETVDDAAGEAFDKVARLMGLGYPGGPIIDRLARTQPPTNLHFPYAAMPDTFNFSFSGTKTAVLYYIRDHKHDKTISLSEIAYAFQESVISIIVKKSILACQKMKTHDVIVGGGVAANSFLRNYLSHEAKRVKINTYFPPIELCMDNAAIIAGLGFHLSNN